MPGRVTGAPLTMLSPARRAANTDAGEASTRAGSPSSTMRPSPMTIMREARDRTSAMSWETSRVVIPAPARRSRRTAETWAVASTSRAAVGSSRIRTSGRKTRARAIATRAAWPPDRSEARLCASSAIPTARSCSRAAARACARPTPRTRRGKATLDRTLMWVKMRGAWETMATPRRRAGTNVAASSTTRSPMLTAPLSTRRVPAITWASVDFPAPLWPTTAVTRPGRSSASTSQPRAPTVPATRTATPSPASPASAEGAAGRAEGSVGAEAGPRLVRRRKKASRPHGVSVSATTAAATPRRTTPSARARSASDSRAR